MSDLMAKGLVNSSEEWVCCMSDLMAKGLVNNSDGWVLSTAVKGGCVVV